jgi:phytoene dehydrogenase-like protein
VTSYDAVIIGAGHNGLTAAAYLARAGRKVVVLERRHVIGGAAVTEEVFPGFKFSVCSYVVSLLRPEIIADLELPRHGLHLLPLDGTFTPLPDGDYLWRTDDHDFTRRELARHSTRDAERYDDFARAMARIAAFIKPTLAMTPPDIHRPGFRGAVQLAGLARRFRHLSPSDQTLLIEMMTVSVVDFLRQWFETDALIATMAASGTIGTFLGVRSPGTAYVLLHHYMGEIDGVFRSWGLARGGTGSVSNAIAAAAREAGAEIRTNASVARIRVEGGSAIGVLLEDGESIDARLVASSADPRVTFERLLDSTVLPEDFATGVRNYRYRGASAKVNLALADLPRFTAKPDGDAHLRGAISISPSVDYMERAYDEAKYGRFSRRPYMDIVIPSLSDPTVASPGQHVMSCFVQYAPYHLAEGTWDDQREALGDAVIETLAEYAPNIRDIVRHRQIVTPLDLEREWSLTEGNIFQGELSPDQLFFMRPVAGWAQYRTPVKGLYLCGAATHPGGGIMGAPGRNAARVILSES